MLRRFAIALVLGSLMLASSAEAIRAAPVREDARSVMHSSALLWVHHPLGHTRLRHARRHAKRARGGAPARLRFGIYPWANAGAAAQVDPALADQPFKALAAVKELKGNRSMTVHIYGQYTGADPQEAAHLLSDAQWWSDNGIGVEMVLRYRPAAPSLAAGFAPWVDAVSRQLAGIPGVRSIQVGNEVNNTSSAAAGDGAYPGAVQAVAVGLPVARAAVIAAGRPDIRIGFNWAAGTNPCELDPFFASLRRAGGPAFTSAVQWVGVDIYPGTWSAPSPSVFPTPALTQGSVQSALACLRMQQMPSAGLGAGVTITLAETGYPTDPVRTVATQASVLRAIVGAVLRVSRPLGVTDLRWFDLRDANTSSGQLENGYGLMRDDYSPKPAFSAFQQVISASGI